MLRFDFLGLLGTSAVVAQGDICRLYEGPPYTAAELSGEPSVSFLTAEVDEVDSVQFNVNRDAFALVLVNGSGEIYGRSNGYMTSDFADEEHIELVALAHSHTLTADDVEDFLPEVPFEQGGLTVTALDVSLGSGAVTATGSCTFGSGLFQFTMAFTYVFALERVTKPVWLPDNPTTDQVENVRAVVTVDSQSMSATGANPIQDVILFLLRGVIKNRLEETIEERLANALDDALDDIDSAAVTVLDASISSSGIVLDVVILAPPFCAGQTGSGSSSSSSSSSQSGQRSRSFLRPIEEVARLREIRKGVLVPTPRGAQLNAMFDAHNRELLRLFLRHPKMLARLNEIARPVLAESGDVRKHVLSEKTVLSLSDVLRDMHEFASAELRASIEAVAESLSGRKDVIVGKYLDEKPHPIDLSSSKKPAGKNDREKEPRGDKQQDR